jgi:hypothetical protein
MSEIRTHVTNAANDMLKVFATDEPGSGGANFRYVMLGYDLRTNQSADRKDGPERFGATVLVFQNGPIDDVGVNGLTHEALLAVVVDRLEGFQRGPFACNDNTQALTALRTAIYWLRHRTEERAERGVEGTHTP